MNSSSRGFALIELMVVCAILASVLYVLFSAITSVAAGKSSAAAPVPEAVTEKKSASPAEKKKGKSA